MIIALWIINIILALLFLMAGSMKTIKTKAQLQESGMTWVTNVSPPLVKLVGIVEVLGALGLILPLATGIAPILTPLAAVGLAVTMVIAVIVHVVLKDAPKVSAMPAILGVLSVASAILGFLSL